MPEPIIVEDEDGLEFQLPHKWEICPTCRGEGTRVNPSIDGHGLTEDDFADDPDFLEDYLGGSYDVTCSECQNGKIRMVDAEACEADPKLKRALADYYAALQADADDRAYAAAERRAGC